ncbi:MAG: sugar phosphate isomerase/epimerase [Planctomycetaceae bacterium]|jgi:hexulose-6-phosphate isomerase|nr:sugar phosphate isomerase/epimerase [Planctomycetaceae bacterium]
MTLLRREFFGVVGAAALSAGFLSGGKMFADEVDAAPNYATKIFKSRITANPSKKYCESLKAAGFEGIEISRWNVSPAEALEIRREVESFGLRIHSVMRAWTNVNIENQYAKDIETVKKALRSASTYGADTVLWVTCEAKNVKNLPMPKPWDFDVDFDPATLRVKTVAEGDNTPYEKYIADQNYATESSIRAIEELIPVAAKEGVRIGLENVWNNFWCTPKFFAAFCKYFNSTWVGGYLDLGNHTKYSRCEEWIKELGHNILKLHIKGYKIKNVSGKLGGGDGQWCAIDEATIDWKSVRKALDDVKYNGWVSVEENNHSDERYSKILDNFIAGKKIDEK